MKGFVAGIHVLVSKGDKYLLLLRHKNDEDDPGHWGMPGGGIDVGEQPLDAVIRKTKEETGLEVNITKVLAVYGMPYKGQWSVEIIVFGEYREGNIKLNGEHSDYRWVSRRELIKIEPKDEHVKMLIKFGNWHDSFQ